MILPALPFADIAVNCALLAEREDFGLTALEWMVARMPGGPGRATMLEVEKTRQAVAAAQATSAMFRALAPFEAEVRAFLAGLVAEAVDG